MRKRLCRVILETKSESFSQYFYLWRKRIVFVSYHDGGLIKKPSKKDGGYEYNLLRDALFHMGINPPTSNAGLTLFERLKVCVKNKIYYMDEIRSDNKVVIKGGGRETSFIFETAQSALEAYWRLNKSNIPDEFKFYIESSKNGIVVEAMNHFKKVLENTK